METESWTLNQGIAKWLAAFKIKVLRRMYVGIKVNENWRDQYDKELMQLFRDFDMLSNCQNTGKLVALVGSC